MAVFKALMPLVVILAVVGCQSPREPLLDINSRDFSPVASSQGELLSSTLPSMPPEASAPAPVGNAIGRSLQGRPFVCRTYLGSGASASSPVILVLAGIHGNEGSTVYASSELLKLLDAPGSAASIVPPAHRLIVLPLANPDGYAAHRRQNSAGVDLNRNFPASNWKSTPRGDYWNGPSPLSEPESRIIHNLIVSSHPVRILTLHSIRPPRFGNNYDGPAEGLAKLLASKNHYAVLPTIGYDTPGSLGSWAGNDLHIPTITLEFPSNLPGPKAWSANREAILAFIRGE